MFGCKLCTHYYDNQKTLTSHYLKQHERYQCIEKVKSNSLYSFSLQTCDQLFENDAQLKLHLRESHRRKFCTMTGCDKHFSKLSCLKRHVDSCHNNSTFVCDNCGKVYNDKSNMTRHQKYQCGERVVSTWSPRILRKYRKKSSPANTLSPTSNCEDSDSFSDFISNLGNDTLGIETVTTQISDYNGSIKKLNECVDIMEIDQEYSTDESTHVHENGYHSSTHSESSSEQPEEQSQSDEIIALLTLDPVSSSPEKDDEITSSLHYTFNMEFVLNQWFFDKNFLKQFFSMEDFKSSILRSLMYGECIVYNSNELVSFLVNCNKNDCIKMFFGMLSLIEHVSRMEWSGLLSLEVVMKDCNVDCYFLYSLSIFKEILVTCNSDLSKQMLVSVPEYVKVLLSKRKFMSKADYDSLSQYKNVLKMQLVRHCFSIFCNLVDRKSKGVKSWLVCNWNTMLVTWIGKILSGINLKMFQCLLQVNMLNQLFTETIIIRQEEIIKPYNLHLEMLLWHKVDVSKLKSYNFKQSCNVDRMIDMIYCQYEPNDEVRITEAIATALLEIEARNLLYLGSKENSILWKFESIVDEVASLIKYGSAGQFEEAVEILASEDVTLRGQVFRKLDKNDITRVFASSNFTLKEYERYVLLVRWTAYQCNVTCDEDLNIENPSLLQELFAEVFILLNPVNLSRFKYRIEMHGALSNALLEQIPS